MKKRLSLLVLAAIVLSFVMPAPRAEARVFSQDTVISQDTWIQPGETWIINPGVEVRIANHVKVRVIGGSIENWGALNINGEFKTQFGLSEANTLIKPKIVNEGWLGNRGIMDLRGEVDFQNSDRGTMINNGIVEAVNADIGNEGKIENYGGAEFGTGHTSYLVNRGEITNNWGASITLDHLFNDIGVIVNEGKMDLDGLTSNGGKVTVTSSGQATFHSWVNTRQHNLYMESKFENEGLIVALEGCEWENWGKINNTGTLENNGRLENGHINYSLGDKIRGILINWGTVNNKEKGTIADIFGQGLVNQPGSTFNNYGQYHARAEEPTRQSLPLPETALDDQVKRDRGTHQGTINNYGQIDVDSYFVTSGTVNNHGVITNLSSDGIDNMGAINNFAIFDNTADGILGNLDTFTNHGQLINDGEVYNNGGTLDNQGTMHNFGAIHNLWGGTITGNPVVDHACRLALGPESALVGQLVTATATVISPTVDAVTFHWTDPTPALRRTFDDTAVPFQDAFAPDLAGDWTVEAVCLEGPTALDTVTLTLTVDDDTDGDGVGDTVEDDAPGGGDGNTDSTADRLQGHIASLRGVDNWRYVTLISPEGTALADVVTTENPSPDDAPVVEFPLGFLDFTIQGLAPGGALTATLVISPPATVDTYYNFGPTPGDPTDHWYEFLFDGTTGAKVISDTVVLHLVDGDRGDSDLQANGQIVGLGAPGAVHRADLALWKTDGPDPMDLGQVLTYTLSLANWGYLTATHTILTDTLPTEVTFAAASSSQGTCAESGGSVVCSLGDLAPLVQATVTLTTTAAVPGWIVNQAQVAGGGLEVDFYDNYVQTWTFVQTDDDLSLSVSDYLDPVPLGEVITYSLLVANNGVYTTTGLIVTDTLPAGTTFVSAEPSQGTCVEAGGTVTCDLGDLPSRWYAEVIVVVTPTHLGEVTNRAGVVGDAAEPVTLNNRDEEETTVVEAAKHTLYLPLVMRHSP